MVLVIGYTAIAVVLIIVGVDLSSVFLARRALSSTADSAALAAAQGIDRRAVYDGSGLECGDSLPLAAGRAVQLADAAVQNDRAGLQHSFRSLTPPQVAVAGNSVGVSISGDVKLPFSRVVSWLDPRSDHGTIRVSETSHAQSPVLGPAC